MDRSFSVAAGRRLLVAALLLLAASVPVGSQVGWDVTEGPSRLSTTGRASGSPVSLRPTDGNADPQGHGYSVSSQHVCGPHVCVHWVIATSDAPPLVDGDANQVPDQADLTLRAFETAWRVEVVQMGFRAPKPDGSSPDHGPNEKLDIYLADVGASGLSGYVATDDPLAEDDTYQYRDYSAYVVVDDDFSVAQLGASGGLGGLRATAAHEFFHAVQFAYDSSEDAWLTEGTAAWMEDRVADDVDANRRWLRSSALVHPWVPIDSSRGLNEYGAWIFWRFLTESEGPHGSDPTLIRGVWELAADGPGDPNLFSARALQEALDSRARSLAGALATFGAWNLAPAAFYEEGAAYPRAPVSGRHHVSVRHPVTGWSTLRLNHLTTGAVSFEPGAGSPGKASLRLTLDAPPRRTGSAARILIFLRSGFLRMVPVTLDADGDADLRVPFSSGQVSRVVLVYANASTSFRCWTGAGYSCNGRSRADEMPFRYRAELVR
ncbi:MAG: MXAN_6640 family putative metalloprotease [Actinomycetota bacterium]